MKKTCGVFLYHSLFSPIHVHMQSLFGSFFLPHYDPPSPFSLTLRARVCLPSIFTPWGGCFLISVSLCRPRSLIPLLNDKLTVDRIAKNIKKTQRQIHQTWRQSGFGKALGHPKGKGESGSRRGRRQKGARDENEAKATRMDMIVFFIALNCYFIFVSSRPLS
ncbi:hypothetical protein F5H01DRAFT_328265 [Linnemannia elongata]|nr:hypothetical protein F5H01DRAFT_328265 [Linnemannia elongata]